MATNHAGRCYRSAYAMLLRLYPRTFHERFGKSMAQTFQDLCREHSDAGRELFWLTLHTFCETLEGIVMEHVMRMNQLGKMTLRAALGALAALMVPLVASRVVDGWNWRPQGFVIVYVLFFAIGMAYALIARRMGAWSYKVGVALALLAGFALGWSNMVHVADSGNPANLWYYSVLVVGIIGVCLARLKPRGLAFTLFAMAAVLALIAIILPSGAPPSMARNMAIGHGVFVALFLTAGLLFRSASLTEAK